jgi:phospholipid transport system substrate-binding protein
MQAKASSLTDLRWDHGMGRLVSMMRMPFVSGPFVLGLAVSLWLGAAGSARAADPAVQFMERVSRDLLAAARSRSPQAMQAAVSRYGDNQAIGLYALGDYRPKLEAVDREPYVSGMVKFIGRYAATEAPKYPVARVTFAQEARKAKYGITVDSTITMQDGTTYEVAWLVVKYGSSYRVRDAQALGFWMTPFLKKLFEDYISQNGGSVKGLVGVLQRH